MKLTSKTLPLEQKAANYLEKHPDYFAGARKPPLLDRLCKPRVLAAAKMKYICDKNVSGAAIAETVVKNVQDMVGLVNTYGTITFVSDSYLEQLGYTYGDVIGKNTFDFVHSDDRPAAERAFSDGMERGFGRTTMRLVKKDGTCLTVEAVGKAILDKNGKFIGEVIVSRDITELIQLTEALKKSKNELEEIFKDSPIAIELYSPNGKLIDANTSTLNLFGVREISDIFGFDLFADINATEEIKKTLRETGSASYEGKFDFDNLKKAGINTSKTGAIRLQISIKKMSNEEIGYIVQVVDITERKAMDKKLIASESKYRNLIDNTHDIIYTLTVDGKFTFVSPSWTTLLGHPINQVEGQDFAPFVHPDDISGCMKFLQAIVQTGQKQEGVEYRVKHTNGSWNWHTSSGVPLKDEAGNTVGFYGIAKDITERKRDQKKIQDALKSTTEANVEKDKFFSIIAHDLKSPFNGILGFLQMLNDEYPALSDEERKKYISIALKSSKKAFSLLEQMLEWRSLHGGKLDGPTIKINVRSLADGATSPLLSAMEKKRIKFQINTGDAMVSAQEIMLERVVANLVSNAIKFTPSDGKGGISISAAKTRDGFVQITVADNGKGISDRMMPDLFSNATAISTNGTDGETGTGLGLPMVKTMVEKMGGKIWVETKVASKDDPASGSKFHFTLPSAQD